MAGVLTPVKPDIPSAGGLSEGGGGFRGGFGGGGGGGRREPDNAALLVRPYQTGMWLALGAMVMVFTAFTSAYVVRKGLSNDWRPIHLPPILWLNTAVLVASSLAIERARGRQGDSRLFWLSVTAGLGLVFLGGQYLAWRQLAAAGVYVASNPSSSFFYLLTGAHGLHLVGGILALFYVVVQAWRRAVWTSKQGTIEATAIYWHFLDGLWIYLFLLLLLGR